MFGGRRGLSSFFFQMNYMISVDRRVVGHRQMGAGGGGGDPEACELLLLLIITDVTFHLFHILFP